MPTETTQATGSYIRRLREAAGLSQRELARRLGCQQPAIARLEAGQVSPNMRTLERIADALGLRLEWHMVDRYQAAATVVDPESQIMLRRRTVRQELL